MLHEGIQVSRSTVLLRQCHVPAALSVEKDPALIGFQVFWTSEQVWDVFGG
jgi:hypothetical protein